MRISAEDWHPCKFQCSAYLEILKQSRTWKNQRVIDTGSGSGTYRRKITRIFARIRVLSGALVFALYCLWISLGRNVRGSTLCA